MEKYHLAQVRNFFHHTHTHAHKREKKTAANTGSGMLYLYTDKISCIRCECLAKLVHCMQALTGCKSLHPTKWTTRCMSVSYAVNVLVLVSLKYLWCELRPSQVQKVKNISRFQKVNSNSLKIPTLLQINKIFFMNFTEFLHLAKWTTRRRSVSYTVNVLMFLKYHWYELRPRQVQEVKNISKRVFQKVKHWKFQLYFKLIYYFLHFVCFLFSLTFYFSLILRKECMILSWFKELAGRFLST